MQHVPKQNIIDILIQYKIGFIINGLLGGVLTLFNDYKIVSLYYFISCFAFACYTAVINFSKSKIVMDYIVKHEYQMIVNHQLDTGFGYIAYLNDFDESEINKLLNSSVKQEFIICYNTQPKLIYPFVILIIECWTIIELMRMQHPQ